VARSLVRVRPVPLAAQQASAAPPVAEQARAVRQAEAPATRVVRPALVRPVAQRAELVAAAVAAARSLNIFVA
jgi:hypothetical protein